VLGEQNDVNAGGSAATIWYVITDADEIEYFVRVRAQKADPEERRLVVTRPVVHLKHLVLRVEGFERAMR